MHQDPSRHSQLQRPPAAKKRRSGRGWLVVITLLVIGLGGYGVMRHYNAPAPNATPTAVVKTNATQRTSTSDKTAAQASAVNTACTGNSGQNIIVSISARHLWACDNAQQLYDSAVVTGMENLPADLTPVGTYNIYAKSTDQYLRGSDSTGSWNDYVHYWMPWLHNQYGSYGFHDATWRDPSAFGNISPDSSDASHGCVELPLAAASWLYNWAAVGTTVTIKA